MTILSTIFSKFWPYILAALGALGLYAKGRVDAKAKADQRKAKDALRTHERINDAEIEDDPDRARDWLRDHADGVRRDGKP